MKPAVARQVDAMRAVLEREATVERASSGPCSGCKHAETKWIYCQGYGLCCTNILVAGADFNVTTHEVDQRTVSCVSARRDGVCGPEGALFEASIVGSNAGLKYTVLAALVIMALVIWWLA